MKKSILIFLILVWIHFSCVQKFHTKKSIPKDLPQEVPEMILTKYREDQKIDTSHLFHYYTPRFFISKHEITNKQFCQFLNVDSIRNNKELVKDLIDLTHKESKIFLTAENVYAPIKGYSNYPVVLVSWWGANFYCNWLTAFVNKKREQSALFQLPRYRLPSEYEWLSATATNSVAQPSYDTKDLCDSIETRSYAPYFDVQNVKKDTLNYMGIAGMNENVYEWTSTDFYARDLITDFSMSLAYYEQTDSAVVRKHGFIYNQKENNTCGRVSRFRDGFYSDTGFRIVQTYLGRATGVEF